MSKYVTMITTQNKTLTNKVTILEHKILELTNEINSLRKKNYNLIQENTELRNRRSSGTSALEMILNTSMYEQITNSFIIETPIKEEF